MKLQKAITILLFLCLLPLASQSQSGYPDRPIKLIVGFPAGQATDTLARLVGERLSKALGQPIVVDNRPGQAGSIALATLAKAPGDGYTLMLSATAALVINPHLYRSVGYDPFTDFVPVGLVADAPLTLVANPQAPFNTISEFIAYSKAHPGELSYASTGNGTVSHLAMELFKQEANISLTHVPYPGSTKAITDLIAGNITVGFDTASVTAPQVASKRLKAIAVGSSKPLAAFPGVPTVSESGLPNFVASPWIGMIAPKGTPPNIVEKVGRALSTIVSDPEMAKSILSVGMVSRQGSREEFGKLMQADFERWGALVKTSGAKVD
jgi:tripartite-type tricarboxylate transporter receptor subunit TctC